MYYILFIPTGTFITHYSSCNRRFETMEKANQYIDEAIEYFSNSDYFGSQNRRCREEYEIIEI